MGFAASADFVDLDDGWPGVRAGLAAVGIDPVVVVWDRPGDLDPRVELVIVNYCWGYVTRRAAFLRWVDAAGEGRQVANPVPVLRWNSDKTYLADLAAAGVPTVPTTWVAPGARWSPPGEDFVIKPTVGSGGWGAARYSGGDPAGADRHLRDLHAAGGTAMVQPYQPAVDDGGEVALVYFGTRFSHAVRKGPMLVAGEGVQPDRWRRQIVTPVTPASGHRELAEATMGAIGGRFGPTTYARVDVIDGVQGQPLVLEVELVEPSLFLASAPGATGRFVEAVARALR